MGEKAYEYVDPMRDTVSMMAKKMMESRHWPDDPIHMFRDEISVFAMSIFRAIVSDIRRNPAATSAVLATPPTDKKRRPR